MSNPEDQKLKDLLNKKDRSHLDDFEKEALEGFDTLNGEEEALALKEKLDNRVQNDLFNEKKSRRSFFWMAAAALVLLTGLSAWFMLNNTSQLTGQQDLAVITQKESPGNTSAPEKSFEAKAAEFKQSPTAKENEAPVTTAAPQAPARSLEPKAAPPAALQEQSKQSAGFVAADEAERNKDNAVSRTSRLQEEADDVTPQGDGSEIVVSSHKEKAPLAKNVAAEDKISDAKTSVPVELKKEEARAKKSAAPAAGQPLAASKSVQVTDSTKKTSCYYRGGNAALSKDLEEKLIEKHLNKAFEALVLLDHMKKVSGEITFYKPVNFNSKELKEVEKILRSLNKFDGERYNSISKDHYSCIYRVSYKPSK